MKQEEFEQDPLFIIVIEDAATILCEQHTQAYAEIMASMEKDMRIIEMALEDLDSHRCMACDMQAELNRPQIILPH